MQPSECTKPTIPSLHPDNNILNPPGQGSHGLLVLLLLQVHGVVEQTAGDFGDGIVVVVDILGSVDKEAAKSDLISI